MEVWDIMFEALVKIENSPNEIFSEDDQIRAIASKALTRGKAFKEADKQEKALLALHRGLFDISIHPVGISDSAESMVAAAKSTLQNAEN